MLNGFNIVAKAYRAAMTIFTSTGRRRELGSDLRQLRESCGYNGVEMAHKLNWTQTMISRAETGKRTMSTLEVANYTAVCGLTGDGQKQYLDLVNEPDDHRLKAHAGELADGLRTLIFQESTAAAIELYEPIFIPGITQTPDYARALFEDSGDVPEGEIEAAVKIRMARRGVVTRINPAQCALYIHENALRSIVGGPQVMLEQMLHLLFVCDRPQCSIRVIPADAGSRGLANGSFHIFHYSEDSPVVYVQHQTTCEFLETTSDLRVYRGVLNRVASVALPEAQSREFILRMASEYEKQGAARHGDEVAEE